MINEKKYNLLYGRLYDLAWNNDDIDMQDVKYIQAIKFAVDILDNYSMEGGDLTAKRILFYQKTTIKIINGRKQYECDNNYLHKINYSYYAVISDGNNNYNPVRMCVSCAAKLLIVTLTNFPPTDSSITYTNDHIDWGLIEE